METTLTLKPYSLVWSSMIFGLHELVGVIIITKLCPVKVTKK